MTATPEQLHQLLNHCMAFARTMLTDVGEFYPFGATLGLDGRVGSAGTGNGEAHPDKRDVYRIILAGLTSSAREKSITAAALAANVDIPTDYDSPARDGIRVLLESEGFSRLIYIPYAIEKKGFFAKTRAVTLFEPFSVAIDPSIFGDQSAPN